MEESSRQYDPHQPPELQQMGRGPGVRATSANSIQIDFRFKGVRCRERLGLAPTPANLKFAKRLKATIEHEIATNTFDYAKHFPESPRARKIVSTGTDIRTAMLAYCNTLESQLQPETIDEYRHDAEIVAAGLKGHTVKTLKRAHVRTWVASLTLTKKRIDNLLIPLRGMLNQAVEDEEIDSSPLSGFRTRRVASTSEKIDPFTPAEIERLSKQSLGAVWKFWAWTGLRSGEMIGLQHGDIDGQRVKIQRAVRVGREKVPKTEAGKRVIALLPGARQALATIKKHEDQPHVFLNPNTGERWHEDRGLARAFRKDCAAAKVRYRYPNQLRHTFATWALSSGENPKWAATQMGHKDMITFYRVYAKWMPSLDKTAGSKMTNAAKSKAA